MGKTVKFLLRVLRPELLCTPSLQHCIERESVTIYDKQQGIDEGNGFDPGKEKCSNGFGFFFFNLVKSSALVSLWCKRVE